MDRFLRRLLIDHWKYSSMNEYRLYLARIYTRNALRVALDNRSIRPALLEWLSQDEARLEFLATRDLVRKKDNGEGAIGYLKRAVIALEKNTHVRPPRCPEQSATRIVVRRFSLGASAASLLEFAHCFNHCHIVENLCRTLDGLCSYPMDIWEIVLNRHGREIHKGIRELAEKGIVVPEMVHRLNECNDPDDLIHTWFWEVWHPPVRNMDELTARLVGKPSRARLRLDDFTHVSEREDIHRVLSETSRRRHEGAPARGVNILLFGRPGTGKTEFARTVAKAAGMRLFTMSSYGIFDKESCNTAHDRRADYRNRLRMAQTLLRSLSDAAILCDEAEDTLESSSGARLANHRLIEENSVPVLYTVNSLDDLDESMMRRFTHVVRFTAHGPTRQTGILHRILAESGIKGVDASVCARRLVDELECTPGILSKAIETTRLVGGSEADVYRYCEQLERNITTQYARPRLGPPVQAELPWEAFSYLEKDAEDARKTLASITDSRKKGINILLYGPPGTGKTEFARTLCGELGARLYAVGANEVGPKSRRTVSRTEALDYALEALAHEPGVVVFFDEMEDFECVEKHWLNRVLEENPVPIIWACNSIDYYRIFLPFFIDRMMHAIEFRHMSVVARKRIFTGILSKDGIPEAEASQLAVDLARDRKVTPRQLAMATRQAAMANGNAGTIRRNIAQKAKLRYGVSASDSKPISRYVPALVHADADLEDLAERIAAMDARRFALFLYGPPGTGKTAYVGYIAERMGMDLLPKRASDLLSKWLGQTEQQMAAAFSEAVETQSFLVFDEVDSLLMDRQQAVRSWETSMVNELLSQMERHPLPFACTTNRREAIDPAAARRFLFRVEFFFMDRERVERAFRFFYGCEAPEETLALDKLTPADFANVRERAKILNFLKDPERIGRALAEECRAKPGGGQLGF